MWIFRYLGCLIYNHSFADITWEGLRHQYCLRCGTIEVQDAAEQRVLAEVRDYRGQTQIHHS